MPAPCRLSNTVFVCSEKTLPSVSLPTRRILSSFGIRLLRRTPSGAIGLSFSRGCSKAMVLWENCFRHGLSMENDAQAASLIGSATGERLPGPSFHQMVDDAKIRCGVAINTPNAASHRYG